MVFLPSSPTHRARAPCLRGVSMEHILLWVLLGVQGFGEPGELDKR